MQVTVDLRPMFSYSLVPILLIIILMIIIFIYLRPHKKKDIKKTIVIPSHKDLAVIKKDYLLKIQKLLDDFNNNKISNRLAYQSLSRLIRNFIYEATNIKVQYYTLQDIAKVNMPVLYELVSEYYDPEFSKISKGNIVSSIEKTRKVIEKWN